MARVRSALLLCLALAQSSSSFVTSVRSRRMVAPRTPRSAGPGNDDIDSVDNAGEEVDPFMASLRARVELLKERETKLPVLVLDSMLPRQVLRLESSDPVFVRLVRQLVDPTKDGSRLAMVGQWMPNAPKGDHRVAPLKVGVEVGVLGEPEFFSKPGSRGPAGVRGGEERVRVALRAGRRLALEGGVGSAPGGWPECRVVFVDEAAGAGAGTDAGGDDDDELEALQSCPPTGARAEILAAA
eukprot:CAMPEP_0172609998 /NCGR_PEP_ID=MMETSP1068-20121228/29879_1 /TAXON_ID=35684 /ORGANISM="Pseudopedinella elastica, Strain CCMP716" /LENGTH=240 /DNA_ID=CAMNT_0013413621 /DNA_START=47 /DNA_END=765 /DNA_ORIENTATION=+